jgi:AraC-like DNA-binding protein
LNAAKLTEMMNLPLIDLEPIFTFIPKGLDKYVRYVAIYRLEEGQKDYLVNFIPRGSLELIFQCGNSGFHKPATPASSWTERPDTFVGGVQSGAFQARLSPGYFVSIDFRPGMSGYFIPGSQAEFGNRVIDAREVFLTEFQNLADQLRTQHPSAQTIGIISRALWSAFLPREPSRVELILHEIEKNAGNVEIPHLEGVAGLKTSQFRNRFREEVGISPKRYLSIVRTQAILSDLEKPLNSFGKLTDLAYCHGYHDQAHFIREFKQITGFTPGRMRKLVASREIFVNPKRSPLSELAF